jgi:hypothetical protein
MEVILRVSPKIYGGKKETKSKKGGQIIPIIKGDTCSNTY